jgi:hypothetical protein
MAKRSGVGFALPALVLAAMIGRCGTGAPSTPQSKVVSSPSGSHWTPSNTAAASTQEAPLPAGPTPRTSVRTHNVRSKALPAKSARQSSPTAGDLRQADGSPSARSKAPTPKDVARIKRQLIEESIDQYSGSCPCPYNSASNGSSCGRRSAYSRPGGASPLCYPGDVTDAMVVAAWEAEARR